MARAEKITERDREVLAVYRRLKSSRKTAAELDVKHSTVDGVLAKLKRLGVDPQNRPPKGDPVAPEDVDKPLYGGRVGTFDRTVLPVPKRGKVARFLCTTAQNNTPVHADFWRNLNAFAKAIGATILVSRSSYNLNSFHQLQKPGAEVSQDEYWYAPEVMPFVSDMSIEIAPGLVWCGELNILPTAARPLEGLETYTGIKSAIVPHAKIAAVSIAGSREDGAKMNYTTGTVTVRNYIQKKAGQKAEFHHSYGALLVEVDSEGDWFARHINADSEGNFFDLDVKVKDGRVTRSKRVEHVASITWGDEHVSRLDPTVARLAWGIEMDDSGFVIDEQSREVSVFETLRPKHQFHHDLIDFYPRNHHELKNTHKMFERWVGGDRTNTVRKELEDGRSFLQATSAPWCQDHVVESNHNEALERWLRDNPAAYAFDPPNAVFFLKLQLRKFEAIQDREEDFHMLEWVMNRLLGPEMKTHFMRANESFILCPDKGGGIEQGWHGHYGADGARGNARNLSRMGRKANVGHSHSAGIHDGMYVAGTSSLLDLGYNQGPSSWSHTFVVTYENGKRTLVTIRNGKWRAE